MLRTFLSIIGLTLAIIVNGQSINKYWSQYDESDATGERWIIPDKYNAVTLDISLITLLMDQDRTSQSINIDIPLPDGSFETFAISRNQVMPDNLINKYPQIATFTGQSLSKANRSLYLDITPRGLHAMIIGGEKSVFVDPYYKDYSDAYVTYFKKDFSINPSQRWTCELGDNKSKINDPVQDLGEEIKSNRNQKAALVTKRYELAVTVTGEYTALFGGTVAGGLAAVVTAINRVTGVYETETGVQLSLVPNNDLLIFTDPQTDPFTNSSGDLNRAQPAITAAIGFENYDIGHIFTSSNGGVAGLGVVCGNSKGRGLTGLPNPTGDPFYIDYVAHEIGHQFDGNHTFNGDSGSCSGGNRAGIAAYEPGSGSTIMAYAGICGNDNTQNNSDAYFHLKSLKEITDFVNGGASGCATDINLGNNMPTSNANAGAIDGKTIPVSTPFELTGDGSDPDNNGLTYQWDEWDLGPQQDVNAGDNGSSPIFRSWFATNKKTRIFPRLEDLLNNTTVVGETLPTTDRQLNFKFIVRDNKGGWMDDQITLNVASAAGPFMVTSHNATSTISEDVTVTWDVAGTTANGIDCANVDIFLSTDGGQSFAFQLADDVSNDGSALVSLPIATSSTVRIKVKCADNVFFDINDVDLMIVPPSFPCNTTMVVDAVPILDGIYSSADVLTSSGTVPAGGDVIFTGTTGISLLNNFEVVQTGKLEAHILPCTE